VTVFSPSEKQRLQEGLWEPEKRDYQLFRRYFKTEWWERLRRRVLEKEPVCQRCRCRPSSHVHHVKYRFFSEQPGHLQALCGNCHQYRVHRRKFKDF